MISKLSAKYQFCAIHTADNTDDYLKKSIVSEKSPSFRPARVGCVYHYRKRYFLFLFLFYLRPNNIFRALHLNLFYLMYTCYVQPVIDYVILGKENSEIYLSLPPVRSPSIPLPSIFNFNTLKGTRPYWAYLRPSVPRSLPRPLPPSLAGTADTTSPSESLPPSPPSLSRPSPSLSLG